jgi:hypothetical protein
MVWHYSWVRGGADEEDPKDSREALKRKCAGWGHAADRDWAALIDEAFDQLERGKVPEREFVHGRRLVAVDPSASPLREVSFTLVLENSLQ